MSDYLIRATFYAASLGWCVAFGVSALTGDGVRSDYLTLAIVSWIAGTVVQIQYEMSTHAERGDR